MLNGSLVHAAPVAAIQGGMEVLLHEAQGCRLRVCHSAELRLKVNTQHLSNHELKRIVICCHRRSASKLCEQATCRHLPFTILVYFTYCLHSVFLCASLCSLSSPHLTPHFNLLCKNSPCKLTGTTQVGCSQSHMGCDLPENLACPFFANRMRQTNLLLKRLWRHRAGSLKIQNDGGHPTAPMS